jgi:DeoR family suf operon transcriptional repressor
MRFTPGATAEPRSADHAVIDLLRVDGPQSIGELAASLGVTATAVRQRLDRLMRQGLVARETMGGRRGRPAHAYSLTDAGQRVGGDNFRDLSLVLWREIRSIRDPAVRSGLLGRIGASLASLHRDTVTGETPGDRLEGVAALLQRSNISCTVDHVTDDQCADKRPAVVHAVGDHACDSVAPGSGEARAQTSCLAVLTSYACPYPDLAEEDRGICAAERLMIEEIVGSPVRLSECRLDGGSCCRFTVAESDSGRSAPCPDDLRQDDRRQADLDPRESFPAASSRTVSGTAADLPDPD